jgi:hypothetical protein
MREHPIFTTLHFEHTTIYGFTVMTLDISLLATLFSYPFPILNVWIEIFLIKGTLSAHQLIVLGLFANRAVLERHLHLECW